MGLIKPKWMSTDWAVACDAVERITDQDTLLLAASEASSIAARCLAVKRLRSEKDLAYVAQSNESDLVRECAAERLEAEDVLGDIALNDSEQKVRLTAIKKITSQQTLRIAAFGDESAFVRKEAAVRLKSQRDLIGIVDKESSDAVIEAVIPLIDDSDVIEYAYAKIAVLAHPTSLRGFRALEHISADNYLLLNFIIQSTKNKDIYDEALKKRGRSRAAQELLAKSIIKYGCGFRFWNDALTDEDLWAQIVCRAVYPGRLWWVKNELMPRIRLQQTFLTIATKGCDWRVRREAVSRLENIEDIRGIYASDKDWEVRDMARSRIQALEERAHGGYSDG